MVDLEKVRREFSNWILLLALKKMQVTGAMDGVLLEVVRGQYHDFTKREVREGLDYLAKRDLIIIDKQPRGDWRAAIGRYGIDVVNYTVPCEAGIARPEPYERERE